MAGLNSGMNACVSGLKGVSARVNCHSQNLAAVGAYASKSRQAFLSVVNTGKSLDAFIPAGITATQQHFISTVGSPVQSSVDTHMSLDGQGFFVINKKADDASPGQYGFTRVGTFVEDKNHNFVNHVGEYLKVFYVDADGNPTSGNTSTIDALETASSASLSGNPSATTAATIKGVLAGSVGIGATKSMIMNAYDSLGVAQTVTLNFTKTQVSPMEWTVAVSSPNATTIGAPYDTGMVIQFDAHGNPSQINGGTAAPDLNITWSTAAAPSVISMNFGAIGGTNGMRSFGTEKSYDLPQPTVDGMQAGKYMRTSIDEQGYMWATFDNGDSRRYARIPLATFPNPNKLVEQTGGSFVSSGDSGGYSLNFTNEGTAGGIRAASLEESTIDTAEVFTDLIVDQQRYTADLRGISTIEEMLQALDRALA